MQKFGWRIMIMMPQYRVTKPAVGCRRLPMHVRALSEGLLSCPAAAYGCSGRTDAIRARICHCRVNRAEPTWLRFQTASELDSADSAQRRTRAAAADEELMLVDHR